MISPESPTISRSSRAAPTHKGLHPLAIVFLAAVIIPVGAQIGPLHLSGLRGFLLVVVTPLLVLLLAGRFGRLNLVDFLLFFHVAWMAVALSVTKTTNTIEAAGSTGLEFLGGYLIGRATIQTRQQFISLCKWLGWIVVSMLPIALYEAQTGDPIVVTLISRIPGIETSQIVTTEGRLGLERVQGTFEGPIHFGMFCSSAFALTLVGLYEIYGTTKRIFISVVVALVTFLSLSSGAILALVIQLGLITWFLVLKRVKWRWWLMLSFIALAYIAVDLMSDRSPIRVFMSYAAFSSHNAFFRGVIFEWGIKNVFGDIEAGVPAAVMYGIGFADWVRPDWMAPASVDNFWLLLAMRYGVPGALSLIIAYVWAIARSGMRNMDGDDALMRLRRAWIFTFIGFAFTLSTVHIWTSLYSFVFFLFGSGIWLLRAEPSNQEKAGEAALGDGVAPLNIYSRFPVRQQIRSA